MAKSLRGLWLKSIQRIGRVQQAQGRKLFKSLLSPVVSVPSKRRAAKASALRPGRPTGIASKRRASPAAPVSGTAALPGTWQRSYFSRPATAQTASARRMQYWLYLPSNNSPGSTVPRPLVVMLHGCQQTATDFATATRMNALAERKGFAVLYPQQSAASDSHRCWHWYKRSTLQGAGDARLVAEMLAHVQLKHALDRSRTYVAGLSAGAALATIVALRYPEMVAAVGLHSAPVFGSSDSAMTAYRTMQQGAAPGHSDTAQAFLEAAPHFPGMPAIVIHGARDAVVRHINAEQLFRQFKAVNDALITQTGPLRQHYPARAGGRSPQHAYERVTFRAGRKPQLVRCDIAALGHAWSGGDPSVAFSEREGPDATLLMWNFFARHRRDV